MKKLISILIIVILFFSLVAVGQAEKRVDVEYFYDPVCTKCAKAGPVIDSVINSYGKQVNFVKYNIATDEGFALGKKYQVSGIPYIVVNKNTHIEYKDYNGHLPKLDTLLRESIDKALAETEVVTKEDTKETPGFEIIQTIPIITIIYMKFQRIQRKKIRK